MTAGEKLRKFIRDAWGYVAIVMICAIYVLSSFINISSQQQMSVQDIAANGIIAYILGISINRIFELQGMTIGDRDERVIATNQLHGEMVTKIAPYIDRLDDWCEMKNIENLRTQRTKILASAGLRYAKYFNPDGSILEEPEFDTDSKVERKKYRAYQKALNLRLTPLTASALTSEGGKKYDIYNFGKTKAQYEKSASLKDILTKLVTAFIFGYFTVSLITNYSRADLIWKLMQVGIFLLLGTVKMYQARAFIVDDHRLSTVKKIDNLQMFENYIKAEPNNGNNEK